MAIYLSAFTLSILLAFGAHEKRENGTLSLLLMFCSSIPLLILAGYRDLTVGSDTAAYPLQAYNMGRYYEFSLYYSLEPLFAFIGYLVFLIKGDFNTMLLMIHAIILFSFWGGLWRLRKQIPIWLAVFFFCFLLFNMSIQLSRQALAMSIIFLGFTYLQRKQIFVFLMFVVIGFLFHRSAIAAVLLIPYIYYERNKKLQFMLLLGSLLVLLFYNVTLSRLTALQLFEKYEKYSEGGDYEGKLSYSEFILRLVFLLIICYKYKWKWSSHLFLLFLTEFCINLLQLYSRYMGRIGMCIYILYIYYIPYLMTSKARRFKNMPVLRLVIVTFTFFYWWYVYIHSHAGGTYPYTSKVLGI